MTELLATELALSGFESERAFLKLPEQPELPPGCLRAERARTARPYSYVIVTWWADTASRKRFESAGGVWPGTEVAGVLRLERSAFTSASSSTIRAHCPECGELVPVTVRPAGETCSICGFALPGRPSQRALPAPLAPLASGPASDLTGFDLSPDTRRTVETYFRAWNTAEPEARRPLLVLALTDDARYQDPATPEPVAGRASIDAFISAMRSRFAGVTFELVHAFGRGPRITAEWRMTLPTPGGDSVTPGVDIIELGDGGRIARVIAYFDRAPAVWLQANRAFA